MKLVGVLLLVSSLSGSAIADEITLDRVCVELDTGDGLVEADRAHATQLLRQVLEREDQLVVMAGCTETYRLAHERTDGGYVIRLHSSAGKRRLTTPSLDDLAAKYTKLARSLLAAPRPAPPAPATPPEPTLAPSAPTAEPAAEPPPAVFTPRTVPERYVDAEEPPSEEPPRKQRLWYGLIGTMVGGGVTSTAGHRRDLDNVTLDLSLALREGEYMGGAGGLSAGAEVLAKKIATPSFAAYAGGGLSLGRAERSGNFPASGGGLQGELTAGLDFGNKGLHALVQLDLTLPFYVLSDDGYAPAFVVSAGLGY